VTSPPTPLALALTDGLAQVQAAAEREASGTDASGEFPLAALAALRASGLLGLLVPAACGGLGGSTTDLVDATARLARTDLSVALIFAMHCQQAATLARYAGDELRAAVLPALGRGEVYLASVTTQPGSGGGLLTSDSPLRVAGDGLVLIDREAPIVTGGARADAFLITMLAAGATTPGQVSLIYARRDQLTAEVTGTWDALGMRATGSVPMRLSGTVPASQIVGQPGGFRSMVTEVFGPLAHLGWAAAWLGAASGALSRVVGYLRGEEGRRRFSPQSELLLIRLARVRGRLDTVHSLLRHTVDVLQTAGDLSAPPVQLLVNALKTTAASECFEAVHELVELVGLQRGYLRGSPLYLERVFRDLRSASLNFSSDRLLLVNGALALLDREVRLA
jgi:acyl-CoA dehydrogenase